MTTKQTKALFSFTFNEKKYDLVKNITIFFLNKKLLHQTTKSSYFTSDYCSISREL